MPGADRTNGTRPDDPMARADDRAKSPPPTSILLVRHGTTETTGKRLPGRAPGLHLAAAGVRQAEEAAARIVRMTTRGDGAPVGARAAGGAEAAGNADAAAADATATPERSDGPGVPSPGPGGVAAVYASPLERARETARPIAAAVGCEVVVDEGLLELDVGDWTGIELAEAYKRPEWATIQRYPSGFTFPGGESFVAMQARMVATLERLRTRHLGQTVVAVSHADPIRAAIAHAIGTHLDLFQRLVVSPASLTAIAYGGDGPIVLTVNATGETTPLIPS